MKCYHNFVFHLISLYGVFMVISARKSTAYFFSETNFVFCPQQLQISDLPLRNSLFLLSNIICF
jgi:hypothetical protein